MVPATRRQFLQMLLVGSGGALLAACSQPAQPAPPPAPVATQAPVPTQPAPAAKPAATQPPAPSAAPTVVAATQVKDVNFVVVDGAEPSSLDPARAAGATTQPIHAIYESLVNWNSKNEPVPWLATSWDPSPDGKVWTFRLRQGVKFHDGTPFTSQDVKATFEHIVDKATGAPRQATYSLIKSIDTPDDYTVKFTIDPPTPDLPFLMPDTSARIISSAALKKYGADFGRNPVGSGPFKFEEWKPNDHVSAVVNPDYWGPKPQVRRYLFKPVPEASARVIMLRTGEADVVMSLPPGDVENLRQDSNLQVNTTQSNTIVEAEPRQSVPPFSDVRIRLALNQAVDKDAIIKNIMKGFARPLNTPSVPGLWGTVDLDPIPYDPARAKQLVAEAGYPNGTDIKFIYVSGRWAGDDQVAEALQGYWTSVGLRTTITKITTADMQPWLSADPDTRAGVVVLLLKSSDYIDYHLWRLYHSASTHAETQQRYAYGNPEVDKLIDQERVTYDPAKRLEVLKQAQQLIWKDQPIVFLFNQVNVWGQRKNVSGFTVFSGGQVIPGPVQKA